MDNSGLFFLFAVYNETVLCLASKALSTPGTFLQWGLVEGVGGGWVAVKRFPSFSPPFIISERFVLHFV